MRQSYCLYFFHSLKLLLLNLICLIKKHEFLKCELENIDARMPRTLRNMLGKYVSI